MDIETILYAGYILMWPTLTLGVLIYICGAVAWDVRKAKKEGRDLV